MEAGSTKLSSNTVSSLSKTTTMYKLYSAITLCLLAFTASAQINHPGEPTDWRAPEVLDQTGFMLMPEINLAELQAEDQERDQHKEFAFRFGFDRDVNFNPSTHGTWTENDNGDLVWRLGILCPEAQTISFRFDEFKMDEGTEVYIYDAAQTHFLGAFTHENNKKWHSLSTSMIYTNTAIIELVVPAGTSEDSWKLSVDQVTHGYRSLHSKFEEVAQMERGPFGNSGNCNIGINCPEGDDWQIEKRSVALIASGGFAVCTGAMVNNTAQDGTPYFLTANHCLGGENNWVFYFNHEAANCGGNDGPTNQSISGSSLKASNGGSDFGLLELSSIPPANFNVQYAGWDNSDSETVTAATGIHHPSGDLKMICHETDDPYHATSGGAAVWYIDEWEEGVTEGGSSGSPLFDQNHRIIGQLYGGYAACAGTVNNGEADWYGRLGVSWDGNSASSRLHDWLDPQGTGVTSIDGWPEGAEVYAIDASAQGINNVGSSTCDPSPVDPVFTLKNSGSETLTSATIIYSYNGGSDVQIDWTGSLALNATEAVELNQLWPEPGTNTIAIEVSNPNGQADDNANNNSSSFDFDLIIGQEQIVVTLLTDDYGYETYWELREPDGDVLASGGNEVVGPEGGELQVAADTDPTAYGNNELIVEVVDFYSWGCYEFVLVDDWGDGICCGFGNGYYEVLDGNGDIMAAGGEFGGAQLDVFGMQNGLSIDVKPKSRFDVYPNPSSGQFSIITGQEVELGTPIIVHDQMGKVVWQDNVTTTKNQPLDLSHLPIGLYHISVRATNKVMSEKIMIR